MRTWEKRIENERKKVSQFPLLPTEKPDIWNSVLPGPAGTPYAGSQFIVEFRIPAGYPFEAPYVQFRTPIYHVNIHESGIPYCPLVLDGWSATKTLNSIMLFLEDLLKHPDPAYDYKMEARNLLQEDRAAYEAAAAAHPSKMQTAEQL